MIATDGHTPNIDHNRRGSGITKKSKEKQSPDRVGAVKMPASPTPPCNDDPSKWTKSKKKRMRQKRKREEAAAAAAIKLTLESSGSSTPVVSSPTTQSSSGDATATVKNKRQKLQAKKKSPHASSIDVEKSPKKKKKKKSQTMTKMNNAETDETETASGADATITKSNTKSQMKISLPKRSMMSTLQIAFLERLTSSRFRELNEDLYTKSSQDSFKQFTERPELFDQYHVGFRKQAKEWPVNPVDVIYKRIVTTWKKEFQAKKGQRCNTDWNVVVADFGCGDAKLAERLLSLTIDTDGQLVNKPSAKGRKGKQNDGNTSCPFQCHSFDLVSGGNPLVTPADMSNVPLPDNSVDVGVYCLALMGTNVADFVRESWRVLKKNGVLRVAEVRSRFETTSADGNSDRHNKGKFGCHKKLKSKNNMHHQSKRSGNNEEEVAQPLMLLDEFLALMQRCGFECTNMDRSNKMFLFMDFVKAGGSGLSKDENFTAKPCIYKRR